jgi:hypothetical protein
MSDAERYFHETWLGMVQPVEGLVVSIPVLVDAQCMERQPPHVQAKLADLCPPVREGEAGPEGHTITDLATFLTDLLGYNATSFDKGDALPDALSLYVPEGRQTLRATMALRKVRRAPKTEGADATPASLAGAAYEMLVWELPVGLDLDKPESVTGTWDYPPSAKLDRLLRHCRVPIGLLTNREAVRLIYAPHGESSGAMTFRVDDMASVGGRPILDAFLMLLSANRLGGVAEDRTLSAILAESRKRQANVTNDLANQVFEALQILLRGFESAAERDGRDLLDDALAREGDHLYKGLLTVLLRLVFLLYAEDRSLLPVEHPLYAEHLSVLSLFEQLQADHGAYPDSMSRRFGAWGRLVTLFRAIFLGVSCGNLQMPPRRGALFNPHDYPFLEGWGPAGSAPIVLAEDRAAVRIPTVDDETVLRVLEKLVLFEGQRLSYRALDVEQIGSVYEALMGYHVVRLPSAAVCMNPHGLWVSAEEVLEIPAARRAKWFKEAVGLSAAQGEKLSEELKEAKQDAVLDALAKHATGSKGEQWLSRAKAMQLVLQPGTERRRTSSHYTPRSLSEPIVRRTLEPLLAVMGEAPSSDRILNLKVCDPAMGSGAFLVEACRFLSDHVLAAWTREGKVAEVAAAHGDALLQARRLVAQRCLYGVDKNRAAVELAKLSLWLVTLSKTLPFTFLDHSLRHGDSLVGLDFDQIRNFHWKKPENETPRQLELFDREIASALEEAIKLRQKIGDLGDSPVDDGEKARLFWDSQDALDRVRLIADLAVGAFFAKEKDKDREAERARRYDLVKAWLAAGNPPSEEFRAMQAAATRHIPIFHWMVEFPEIFYEARRDPVQGDNVRRTVHMDAFLGNPPFVGSAKLSNVAGASYVDFLQAMHDGAHGNSDVCAHFFRRAHALLGTNGTIGFIATNSISEGDTRTTGLKRLLEDGAEIYGAESNVSWPGAAAVSVSLVHIAVGGVARSISTRRLDGVDVAAIDSRLMATRERPDPVPLAASKRICFFNPKIGGQGFVLTFQERADLIRTNPRNAEKIEPYIGGEDVLSSPTQSASRCVIHFGDVDLATAGRWSDLLSIVSERVKPEREKLGNHGPGNHMRKYWWQFYCERPALAVATKGMADVLVVPHLGKHLAIARVSAQQVLAASLYVFALNMHTAFAVLQSCAHYVWARLLSSSMRNDLRYSASDCFETFPFPRPDPRSVIPALEDVGERLYDFRAKYMVDENVGLTITYNRLKDPGCVAPRILQLRRLHEEMDRAVIAAYADGDSAGRWLDLEVPPYCPIGDADKAKLQAFEDAVIDRLFALNARRAEEEAVTGRGAPASKQRKHPVASSSSGSKKASRKKPATEQLALAPSEPDAKS